MNTLRIYGRRLFLLGVTAFALAFAVSPAAAAEESWSCPVICGLGTLACCNLLPSMCQTCALNFDECVDACELFCPVCPQPE